MTDSRQASIYLDDIEKMETAGYLLFKHVENAVALDLLAIALRLRGQTGLGAELTERETRGADGSEWPPRPRSVSFAITGYSGLSSPPEAVVPGAPPAFACSADDIDESAGMAEVVELSAYSKRVPCA